VFFIKTLLLISLFFTFLFSKGEVSKIFAHKESAVSSGYSVNGQGYKWGQGENLVIDGFEYNGTRYNYISDSPIIKIRYVDNNQSNGKPCGLFAQKHDSIYNLSPSYPNTNGKCDMAKVMGGRIINIGALDLFRNVSDAIYDTAKNIERVDFISPEGIVAPNDTLALEKAGHVVTEKSGNNEIKIAPILSIDENNNPTSYGNLVSIKPYYSSEESIRYNNCNIYLPDNTFIYRTSLGFYRDSKKLTDGVQGEVWHINDSLEPMGMAFVSLKDLGIGVGEKYYGFSYFGRDVTDNMNLVDYNSFPKDTSGDTADPYGGVAGYFEDINLSTSSTPFSCSTESYLTSDYNFFSLDFINKTATLIKPNYTTENINAIGYNVNDNLIWGWSRSSKKIIQIDANYRVREFETNIPKFDFVAGDVSKDGILYLSGYDDTNSSHISDNHTIYKVKIENGIPTYLGSVPYSNQNIHFGDYAINPKDNYLYAIDSNSGHLFRLNPQTGEANDLEAVSGLINNQTYFHSYVFDSNGNLYFYSDLNNATVYKIDLSNVTQSDIDNPNFSATIFTNIAQMSASGDGARCANAQMPEIEDNSIPFNCSIDTYLFNGYPKTDAYTIDLSTGNYTLEKSGIDNRINATGYNVKDNFIWGYDINKHAVIRIDANYTVREYNVSGLPSESFYAGDVSLDGILYLHTHTTQGSDKLYKVNLNYTTPQYDGFITLNKTVSFGDFAFNPVDNMLYSIDEVDKNLYKIDISSGTVDSIKNIDINDTIDFHTYVFDRDGNLYFYGTSGKIYKIYIGDGSSSSYSVELFSTTAIQRAGGDGARCPTADMGDDNSSDSGGGICYGLIDNGKIVYEMDLSTNSGERTLNIDKEFVGEGTAYRSVNHTLYAFQTYKNGVVDRHGDTSTLYSIDLNSNNNIVHVVKVKDNIVANEVEGAEFYYDPISKKEILYILTSINEEKNTIKLHAFYADEWDNEIDGYPKNVDGVRLGSLAIDPKTGQGYATDDAGSSAPAEVYKLDLKTGVATFLFKARDKFDSEGLAFAKDGNLYTEDDGYYSGLDRKVYKIDLVNNRYVQVRTLSGSKDIEGLSCNGIALAMENAPLEFSIGDVRKPEGNSGTTSFDFIVSLNKPAPSGGISIEYETKDGSAKDDDFSDDNDTLPKISISDASATEGDDEKIVFDILLDKPAPVGGVTVQVSPQNDANTTAIEGSDYSRITSSIFIPVGEIKKELEYSLIDDNISENTETFSVLLSSAQNGIIDRASGMGTIYDNDGDSSSSDSDNSSSSSWWDIISGWMSKLWGGEDTQKSSQNIQKSKNIYKNTQIQIEKDDNQETQESSTTSTTQTDDSTANIADYQKIQGTLTINEGETNGTIHVLVNGDDEVEGDETFYVFALPPEGTDLGSPIFATGTILDDDNTTPTITQGMLLSRGDGNDDSKTNIYLFDINLSNNSVSNFRLIKKLDKKFRSLDYHNGKYITSDMNGEIYDIDPITGEALLDSEYKKIDNVNINALDFDSNGDIIYETNSSKKLYKYSTNLELSSTIKTFSEELNGAISYLDSDIYSTSFISGGIKNINNDNIEDVPNSHTQLDIYGGDRVSSSKSYFINSQINDLKMYLSQDSEWSSFYDYGASTGGLIGEALAIKPLSEDVFSNDANFTCSQGALYFSNRTKSGESGVDSGATWLHTINQDNIPYSYDYIDNGFVSGNGGYNALAYNPKDNFMYALYSTHLLKIDKNANVTDLGEIQGLLTQLYAGTFDREGNYFVSGDGISNKKLYKIDINQKKVIESIDLSLNSQAVSVKFMDMAIDKSDQYLYAMLLDNNNSNDKFVKIDKNSGEITVIKDKPTGLNSFVELIFSDASGDVFLMEHENGFYKIDTEDGYLYKLSDTNELASYSDGTNCVEANISEPSTISIDKSISQFEGDSGESIFTFGITFSKPAPAGASFDVEYLEGVNAISPRESADENDFKKEAKKTISLLEGTTYYEINVTVYGDIQIEADEEFYIRLSNPKNLAIKNALGVGVILNDDHVNFNIERVNSDNIIPKTEEEQLQKEALYTQIAQKDFDYSIVSYDKNQSNFQEYPVEDITLKIELIDTNSTNSEAVYTYYKYLDTKDSRFDIINSSDLKLKPSRNLIYKISYLEENKTIVKGDFSTHPEVFEDNSSLRWNYSRDTFSIRPAGFKLTLWAGDNENNREQISTNSSEDKVSLASGYNYQLEAKAINNIGEVATNYQTSYNSNILNQEVNATLLFDGNHSTCNDTKDKDLKYYDFIQGVNTNKIFSRDNVGDFIVKLKDENWTNIDHFRDCILNSSSNIADSDGKYGCNIDTTFDISSNSYHDMEVVFEPYSFDINLTVKNNVASSHNGFLYMSDLTQSDNMAILIDGDIFAKEKNGKTTTNFTKGCYAHRVDLSLDYTATTDKGVFHNPSLDTVILTTSTVAKSKQQDTIYIQRKVKHNNEPYSSISESTIFDNNISILKDDFLDTQKGKTSLSILYNIKKSLNKTINPLKIEIHKTTAKSSEASSYILGDSHFIPTGEQILNISKILYYGAILPDRENYPDSFSKIALTPVGVYIYCKDSRDFCNEMIDDNGLNSFKTQVGWYLSIKHDSLSDGTLSPSSLDSVEVKPTPIPNFNQGVKGRIELKTQYIGGTIPIDSPVSTKVDINPSPWLRYHPTLTRHGNPFWKVKFRGDSQKGTMTGVGKTGHIINMNANRDKSNKMDW